jgi:TPR repeat protein
VKWYKKSAEQGYANAQFNLGVKYANGKDAWENYVLAYMWIDFARVQGIELAVKEMEILVRKMTTEQIEEAQKMASEWQAKHSSVSN